MDIRKLQRVIVNALEDVKAQDIKVFNTSKQTALFDRVIVATDPRPRPSCVHGSEGERRRSSRHRRS